MPYFIHNHLLPAPPPPGTTMVFQVYAVDGALNFPESVLIFPAKTVIF